MTHAARRTLRTIATTISLVLSVLVVAYFVNDRWKYRPPIEFLGSSAIDVRDAPPGGVAQVALRFNVLRDDCTINSDSIKFSVVSAEGIVPINQHTPFPIKLGYGAGELRIEFEVHRFLKAGPHFARVQGEFECPDLLTRERLFIKFQSRQMPFTVLGESDE